MESGPFPESDRLITIAVDFFPGSGFSPFDPLVLSAIARPLGPAATGAGTYSAQARRAGGTSHPLTRCLSGRANGPVGDGVL